MKRAIRLVFIALLEFVWVIISVGFFVIFLWGSVQSFGLVGIISGLFIAILAIAGIGGLIFLLIEMYYTLRSIEHTLDNLQDFKVILEKLVKIQYLTYEMFHEYLDSDDAAENSDYSLLAAKEHPSADQSR